MAGTSILSNPSSGLHVVLGRTLKTEITSESASLRIALYKMWVKSPYGDWSAQCPALNVYGASLSRFQGEVVYLYLLIENKFRRTFTSYWVPSHKS